MTDDDINLVSTIYQKLWCQYRFSKIHIRQQIQIGVDVLGRRKEGEGPERKRQGARSAEKKRKNMEGVSDSWRRQRQDGRGRGEWGGGRLILERFSIS